jgi:citrate lyase subunit beta/citryl-CoA lyase
VVVVDLEDAVAPDRKDYARAATAELLSEPQLNVHVRVNALDTPWAADDLRTLTPLPGVSGLRLPKVTSAEDVVAVAEKARDLPLYALLETALGIERAFSIAAAHSSLRGVALGEADLRADLGVRDDAGLDWSRSRVIVAARAAGLAPPPQSVHPDIRDLEGLAASCAHGRALGFLGRAAIHPRQLPVIESAFLPTDRGDRTGRDDRQGGHAGGGRPGAARRPVHRRGGGGGGAENTRVGAPHLNTMRAPRETRGALIVVEPAVSPSSPTRPRLS